MKLFDRKLSEIPCFRKTFLYGISTGLGSGLLHFLFTSRVKRSCDVAFGVFIVSSIGVWIYCRADYAVKKFEIDQITKSIRGR